MRNTIKTGACLAAVLFFAIVPCVRAFGGGGDVVVTRYVRANTGRDVSDEIQKLIDRNPNRTIYFPDGEYVISKPIVTPAEPSKSVALQLSNYAVIRASDDWSDSEAMIRLGGKDPANNIRQNGSNYFLSGGIIDGNGLADGISIDGGRETIVRDCSIKHTRMGLHIKYGANSGSSDCDIHDINIVCAGRPDCVGILVEGYDNTITNVRISGALVGVKLVSAGNYLRNVHPLFYNSPDDYEESVAFVSESDNNWFDFCYSDQFATGFLNDGNENILDNCFVYWYNNVGKRHTAIRSTGRFNAFVTNFTAGIGKWNAASEANLILDAAQDGGYGRITNIVISDPGTLSDCEYLEYLTTDKAGCRSYTDTFETDGVKLFYAVEGCGRPVVLLHGNGGSHNDLETLQRQLANAGYLVYAPDSRGQGANAPLDEYHYIDMAEDVYAFITAMGLDKPAVYGWSDGGIVALELESLHPGTCSLMVTSGANVTADNAIRPDVYEQIFGNHVKDGKVPPLIRMMMEEPDMTREDLERIKVPVLVCAGENDLILEEHTRMIAGTLPAGELLILPGEDHGSYIWHNGKIGRIVLSFFRQHGYL